MFTRLCVFSTSVKVYKPTDPSKLFDEFAKRALKVGTRSFRL